MTVQKDGSDNEDERHETMRRRLAQEWMSVDWYPVAQRQPTQQEELVTSQDPEAPVSLELASGTFFPLSLSSSAAASRVTAALSATRATGMHSSLMSLHLSLLHHPHAFHQYESTSSWVRGFALTWLTCSDFYSIWNWCIKKVWRIILFRQN